jgi:hypothetical protein
MITATAGRVIVRLLFVYEEFCKNVVFCFLVHPPPVSCFCGGEFIRRYGNLVTSMERSD